MHPTKYLQISLFLIFCGGLYQLILPIYFIQPCFTDTGGNLMTVCYPTSVSLWLKQWEYFELRRTPTPFNTFIITEHNEWRVPNYSIKFWMVPLKKILSNCLHCWCQPGQIARFMGPIWGPPGSCGPHVGPMNLAMMVMSVGVMMPNFVIIGNNGGWKKTIPWLPYHWSAGYIWSLTWNNMKFANI